MAKPLVRVGALYSLQCLILLVDDSKDIWPIKSLFHYSLQVLFENRTHLEPELTQVRQEKRSTVTVIKSAKFRV